MIHPKCRGFASHSQNVHRATARAISLSQSDALATKSTPRRAQNAHRATARRAIRSTQSAQRVRFKCSKCAPRHSESDLTHPKCAEGLLRVRKMCTTPQRERFDSPGRRGFASRSQNAHRATAIAISLGQSDALTTKSTPRRTQKRAPLHSESDSTH